MATKMTMPLLGQTMEEGTIIKWFKNEGDSVKEGEPLLEVMTDKVNMEVEAPESAVLRKILAQPDDIVPVQEPICILGTADESIDDLLTEGAPRQAVAVPVAAARPTAEPEAPPVEAAPSAPVAATPAPAQAPSGRVFSSPAARRVAREHGVEIAALAGRGTGPNGRIVEKDVLDYVQAQPRMTPLAAKIAADLSVDAARLAGTGIGGKVTSEDVTRAAQAPAAPMGAEIPLSGLRKAVAKNVAASYQSAVHVTLVTEVDMTECVNLRNQMLPEIERTHGVRVSFTDLIVKAAARAILDKPIVNSSLVDDKIVIHDRVNIGLATAVEGGLVVPVIRDVPSKSLAQIAKENKEVVGRVRSGGASGNDFKDGTFTVTNLGTYGIDSFSPIITPGQSAILAVCAIADKPVVVDGEIKIRSMMNLCLTFDHRVMDGAPAAEYLARVREILQAPYLLLI